MAIGAKADPAGALAPVMTPTPAVPEAPTSLAEVADTAMTPEHAAQIMQMAQIPRDVVDNPKAVAKSVQSALGVLAGAKNGESYLIRRDGITLQALVPTTVLRNFAGNPDMMDGTYIKALGDPTDILGSDLGLLAGPAVRQIIYVMQNKSTLSIERKRPLTVGERRKFGRQLNKVGATGDKYDVGNNIRAFANASGGAFGYTEKFPNLQNPLDMIEVSDGGKKVQVHRWVYDTFLAHGGHSEVSKVRSDTTTIQDAPMTLQQAIQTLNGGGDPFSIPEEFLAQALEESDAYARPTTANQLAMLKKPNSIGVREFHNRAGETIRLIPEDMQYDAISQRVYIDIASQLGLQTPKIRFAGSPKKRAMLVGEILGVDQHTDPKKPLAKVDEKDMLALAFADFLGDVRGRSPATLERIVAPNKTSLVPTTNQPSLLAGLKPEEIKPRLDMSVQDYFDGRATRIFRERFDNIQKPQRENLVKVYDTLLQQAQNFKWDEYLSSISADGHLSDDEQAHLKTVSKMYLKRVEELKNNKQQVLQLLGI